MTLSIGSGRSPYKNIQENMKKILFLFTICFIAGNEMFYLLETNKNRTLKQGFSRYNNRLLES